MSFKRIMAMLVVASLVLTATVAQAGLVAIQNGSFETGDFSGWVALGDEYDIGVFVPASGSGWPAAHHGSYVGYIGSSARIYQKLTDGSTDFTFASVDDTLTVNFSMCKSTTSAVNFHASLWASDAPNSGGPGDAIHYLGGLNPAASENWESKTFTYTAKLDDVGETLWLQFDSMSGGYPVAIDSVSASYAPIPEPSTLVLLIAGLIGLLCYAWRKRK